jgi:hypothetical protein
MCFICEIRSTRSQIVISSGQKKLTFVNSSKPGQNRLSLQRRGEGWGAGPLNLLSRLGRAYNFDYEGEMGGTKTLCSGSADAWGWGVGPEHEHGNGEKLGTVRCDLLQW